MPAEALSRRKIPDLSLVIPCFNEEAVVSHTISRLLKAFQADGYVLEIIAVDNGSSDRTGEILRGFAAMNPAVLHYRVDRNEGYGNGVLNGFPLANAPWVGIIPADGQVDAEDVVRLYEVAQASNSWVLAKVRRRFRLDGVTRKLVSVSYNLVFRLLWPAVASIDINGSPKLMPREAVTAMALKSKGWFLDPEIMIKSHAMGIRVVEFNVFARLRGAGLSHVSAGTCWEFLRNLIKYRLSNDWKRELVMSRSEAAPDYCAADVRS